MTKAAKAAVVIWHNPRCGKSRDTLALLRAHGVEPEIREYLKAPPSRAEVEALLDALGGEPRALVRPEEPPFKESGLKAAALTRKDVVGLVAAHPITLQRPVVVVGKRAAIGRPPDAVLPLIGK